MSEVVLNPLVDGEESHVTETVGHEDASFQADEPKPALARSLEYPEVSLASFRPDLHLPETVTEPDPEVNALKENHYVAPSVSTSDSGTVSKTVANDSSSTDFKLEDMKTIIETNAPIEKTVEIEDDFNFERDYDDVDSWETEESSTTVLANSPSSTLEGPPSFRSISLKSDDGGGSFGSLSRIEGLGRAARSQLVVTLYDFGDTNLLTCFRYGFIYTNVYGMNSFVFALVCALRS